MRVIKKLFLSAFVVISFIAYALHKPASGSNGSVGLAAGSNSGDPSQTLAPTAPPDAPAAQQPANQNPTAAAPTAAVPTSTPTASQASSQNGQYKNGTYTGDEIDALYGLVQVQAVIQNGKITNVQFLEYPNDRRTSVRINSVAVPDLTQEAIQAQSANVNIITGATLTSEAFQMSLQAALNKAKG